MRAETSEEAGLWDRALLDVLAGVGVRAVYQPLVDLSRGVVAGYEGLVRFDGPIRTSPDRWFAAARERGCDEQLEEVALRTVLAGRRDLPGNCFLTINVGPEALATGPVRRLLAEQGNLRGLVIEITEHTPVQSYDALCHELDRHRGNGAMVAIDDAGAGYAGLQHILLLRPDFLKLDMALITDIDRDEAKRALVEMVGTFAARIDAWVIAEGIERAEELATLVALGVPLGQGYHLERPAEPWVGVSATARHELRELHERSRAGGLRPLLEAVPWAPTGDLASAAGMLADGRSDWVVLLDEDRHPVGLADLDAALVRRPLAPLRIGPDTTPADAALRAITRPAATRFHPLVCCDGTGRYLGIVRMERLLHALASPEAVGADAGA